ncbi:hypothetical protein KUL72_20745 [Bradyrhizobium arachidis]|uniref:glycosyl hydrolase family 28-related protein n=1 Tax=Bradyrhizobium arachidis TaxID=858423 RepID=UPI002163CAF9|nr:glycosyl hydrolase family 28-related protein [Bradyrhizobium arachidis]UVO33945.1 hypothetical protein KUL72_20745 [Bradyrhizobium arachidis]
MDHRRRQWQRFLEADSWQGLRFMKFLHRFAVIASTAFLIAGSALAQNAGTVPANEILVGKGPGVTGFGSTYTPSGSGSVARTVRSKLEEVISVKDFGAKCDGSTDDSSAINAADAAAAVAGKALYFPAGICMAQGLNPKRSNLEWFGDGKYLSCIKAVNPGIGYDTLVWFGERTATTAYQNNVVHDMCFDGNSTGTNAVVERRNLQNSVFQNIYITGGASHGFKSETSGTTINTQLLRNWDLHVESASNAGKGFYFNGEKDQQFDGLSAHNNTGDGIYIGPANLNSSALCETTEGYGGNLSTRDNGGDGIVFDMVEKYAVSSIQSSINSGYGIRFRSTIAGCTSNGSNSVNIANATLRNNSLGAIRAADSAYVYGAQFGNVWVRGDNSTVGTIAVNLEGVGSTQFGSVNVQAWPGTSVRVAQGTPLGVTTQSSNIQAGSLLLANNGNAGSATNHGISIENSSSNVSIGSLRAADLQTSGSNYELSVASTASNIFIGSASLNASGGAGNNYSIANTSTFVGNGTTSTRAVDGGASGPAYSFASESGLGFYRATGGAVGFTQLGGERIRFGAGLMVGTTTDSGAGIVNAATGYRVGNVALAASNLSNGTTGTGAVVLAASPSFTGGITTNAASTFNVASSNLNAFNFNVVAASSQVGMSWSQSGTAEWSLYKETDNSLRYYDQVNGTTVAALSQGSSSTASYQVLTTTPATSSSTGALRSSGGLGVAGAGWFGTYVNVTPTVVNSLPSCNAGLDGARAFVTNNATATAFGGAVTTGGSNHHPVYCDGSASAWKQG